LLLSNKPLIVDILGGYSSSGANGDNTILTLMGHAQLEFPTYGAWDDWIVKIDSLGNRQWEYFLFEYHCPGRQ